MIVSIAAHLGIVAGLAVAVMPPSAGSAPPKALMIALVDLPPMTPAKALPLKSASPAPVTPIAPPRPPTMVKNIAARPATPELPAHQPPPRLAQSRAARQQRLAQPDARPQPIQTPERSAMLTGVSARPKPLTPPRLISGPKPDFPKGARQGGVVRIAVFVAVDGHSTATLVSGSGDPRLDHAAIAAVAGWRFAPAMQGDRPVAASIVVPVRFTLSTR